MKEMSKKMNEYGSMNIVAMKEGLEEKHVPGHNDTPEMTVGEIYAQAITKMNAMRKTRTTEMMNGMKTDEFDMAPNPEKLTAMIKDPMKSKEENPKRDLNATYMKSDVRADVKNGGGVDMSKVQDAPKMMTAMKKISAMYKTEKYHDTKPGSLNDALAQMHLNEQKSVSVKVQEFSALVETYLAKGGVVGNISEAVKQVELNKSLKMNEVREFITTYNLHFLTNYAAEEFVVIDEAMMKNHTSGVIKTDRNRAKQIKSWLADNGEQYPVAVDDNGSGQITIDDDGEKGSAYGAGQAIAKKFNVRVMGSR